MTDTYVPTTEMGKAMLHMRHMLALSSTLQAVTGTYAAAFDRIYYKGVPGEDMVAAYGMEEIDMSLPVASIWPHSVRFSMPSPDLVREVGELHVYLLWPTNLTGLVTYNDRLLDAFDKLQGWAKDAVSLSSLADDSADGPIITGESHLAISMVEVPFNEHTPLELRPPGGRDIEEFQNRNKDFQFRHMVVTFGDGEGAQ